MDAGGAARVPIEQTLLLEPPTLPGRTRACQPCVRVPQLTTSPAFAMSHPAINCYAWQSLLIHSLPTRVRTSHQIEPFLVSYPEPTTPAHPAIRVRAFQALSIQIAENGD